MSVIPFPNPSRRQPVQHNATVADLMADCCLELSGHLLDEERAKKAYRVLNRLDVSEMAMLADLLKKVGKVVEVEVEA